MAKVFQAEQPLTLKVPVPLDSDSNIAESFAGVAGEKDLTLSIMGATGLQNYSAMSTFLDKHLTYICGIAFYPGRLKVTANYEAVEE